VQFAQVKKQPEADGAEGTVALLKVHAHWTSLLSEVQVSSYALLLYSAFWSHEMADG
jgi:hypothetical protein